MKKLLLSAAVLVATALSAQTTLLSDDFESGSGNWTFGGASDNNWIVNNSYTGFSGFILDTPFQPGNLQTNYLHIMNATACSFFSACNANFDTGAAANVTTDAGPFNTTGMASVTIDYIYLCAGQAGLSFGTLEYSTDGGSTWTVEAIYSGVSNWTTENTTNAAWDNQADLRFRFRWQNGAGGSDPAFAIDNVTITAMPGAPVNTITTTNDVSPASWCQGSDEVLTVNYTSTGAWNTANVFSIQLSDATGSFVSPTVIGTLASTAASGTVTGTVPGATPVGTGYRVRIVATDPSTNGSDNGSDLVINSLPNVAMTPFADMCEGDDLFTLTGGSPANGTYTGPGVTANVFDVSTAGVGTHTITYTYTDGNGCTNDATETITVDACSSIGELASSFTIYPNPSTSSFVIVGVNQIDELNLIDLSGRTVKTFNNDLTFDISSVPSGTYIVKFTSGADQYQTRLVIQ